MKRQLKNIWPRRMLLAATATLLVLALPAAPRAAGSDGTLDLIGVFGIEETGAARGPWLQQYDGLGERIVNTFLDDDFPDFLIQTADLDGDGPREIVALGVDVEGDSAQLQVRRARGSQVDTVAVLDGEEFASVELLMVDPLGDGLPLIGITHEDDQDTALAIRLWRLRGSAAAGMRAGRLVPDGAFELVPAGFANHQVEAADVDGDGAEEIVVLYTDEQGRSAWLRVLDPRTGLQVSETELFGRGYRSPRLVLGDFRPDRPGREILVGAVRASGKSSMKLLDALGSRLSAGRGSPARSSSVDWLSIAAPAETPSRGNGVAGDRVVVHYETAKGATLYRVFDLTKSRARRVAKARVARGGTPDAWAIGDFDADADNGEELAVVFTAPDRSIWFEFRTGAGKRMGSGKAFEALLHSPQARALRALSQTRSDLVVVASGINTAPSIALIDADGVRLLDLIVLSPAVQ
jgi:hypothetical protein